MGSGAYGGAFSADVELAPVFGAIPRLDELLGTPSLQHPGRPLKAVKRHGAKVEKPFDL
jgi:hypothetical protein